MIFVILIVVVIVAIISVLVGSKKDQAQALDLKKNLSSMGFIATNETEVFDKDNQGKPFLFLIDKQNKKWTLANYRATMANVFNFSDLIDYTVTYRSKGTNMMRGDEYTLKASEYLSNSCCLIEMCQLNGENCDYLEIRAVYSEQAKRSGICSYFILFERQQTFLNAKNNDFLVPTVCVNNAKIFEDMLYHILKENRK